MQQGGAVGSVLGAVAAAQGPELGAALDLEGGGGREAGRTELEAQAGDAERNCPEGAITLSP